MPAAVRRACDRASALWPVRLEHGFHQALGNGMGFSFVLGGQRIGPALPAGSNVTAGEGEGIHEAVYRHPSGLEAVRRCRPLPRFDAVEYTITYRNKGNAALPVLEHVNALDVVFKGPIVKDSTLTTCGGGGADSKFPPKDYALARCALRSAQRVTLSSGEGYPSNKNMPFFFVESETAGTGIYVAIGWTGNWRATIEADSSNDAVRIVGGMPEVHVRLRPGEEISGPTIVLGCYTGRLEDGANALRRLIRRCYTPDVAGRPLVAPIMYTTWFHVGAELATPEGKEVKWKLEEEHVKELEEQIDALDGTLTPLTNFILPGGHPSGAAFHMARTIVRRAEREAVGIDEPVNPLVLSYLNRLSDYLFVAGRYINQQMGEGEKNLHG